MNTDTILTAGQGQGSNKEWAAHPLPEGCSGLVLDAGLPELTTCASSAGVKAQGSFSSLCSDDVQDCLSVVRSKCVHPSMQACIQPASRPASHVSIHPSIHPSIHSPIHISIHPSIYPSIHPFIWVCSVSVSSWPGRSWVPSCCCTPDPQGSPSQCL